VHVNWIWKHKSVFSFICSNSFLENLSNWPVVLLVSNAREGLASLAVFLVVDLLNDSLLISHLRHHFISLLESLYESIDSLVELIQIHFHVFLLALEVLGLLIGMEIFKLILTTISISLMVTMWVFRITVTFVVFSFLSYVISSGVSVFLLHESVSPL